MNDYLQNLRNYWYPVAYSRELPARRPLARTLLGDPLVVYRNLEGEIVALQDRCPHRNMSLSTGRWVQGNVQCAYHGWSFDGAGKLARIPGFCGTKLPSCPAIPRYLACEQDGLIWIFAAPNATLQQTPPPRVPFYEDARYATFYVDLCGESDALDAVENALDPMHTHFVHDGVIRDDKRRKIIKTLLRVEKDTVEASYHDEGRQVGFMGRLFEGDTRVSFNRFLLPLTAQTEYRDSKGETSAIITLIFTPETEGQVRCFVSLSRRTHPWLRKVLPWIARPFVKYTIGQDVNILKDHVQSLKRFPEKKYFFAETDLLTPHIHRIVYQSAEQRAAFQAPEPKKLKIFI